MERSSKGFFFHQQILSMHAELMNPIRAVVRICIIFLLLTEQSSAFSQQQTKISDSTKPFDIKDVSFLLPQPKHKGKYSQALSLVYVVLPKDWTLDVINAPTFCYEGKYTLPKGFNLQGSFTTLLISNRLNLGPFWNYSSG